jgi:hypothetical protein
MSEPFMLSNPSQASETEEKTERKKKIMTKNENATVEKPNSIRPLVRGTYDIQKLRIMMGNRIVGNFKNAVLKLEPGIAEKEASQQAKLILDQVKAAHRRITDGVAKDFPTRKNFQPDGVICTLTELALVDEYVKLLDTEEKHFKLFASVLQADYPFYEHWLKHVQGIGPAMAGVLLSEINITTATYPSSIHAYAGLDVVIDQDGNGTGRSKRKEHLVKRTYISKEGKEEERDSITFNPFLKTKLMGVLAASFLRCGKENTYAKAYYDYKNLLINHPKHQTKTDGHRHQMALRFMVKLFIIDLYKQWRAFEGLPVAEPYHVAKLGLRDHAEEEAPVVLPSEEEDADQKFGLKEEEAA